jgi:hypothetical protein
LIASFPVFATLAFLLVRVSHAYMRRLTLWTLILAYGLLHGTLARADEPAATRPVNGKAKPLVKVTLAGDATGFHVEQTADTITLRGRFAERGAGPGVEMRIQPQLAPLSRIWVPHLAPEPGYVMGDHVFRSPAIILADDRIALALVPDLDDVGRGHAEGWRTWMDFDRAGPLVTLGIGAYRTESHVLFRKEALEYRGQRAHVRVHVVRSDDPADLDNPYRLAARFLWRRWGRPGHESGGSQTAPLREYADAIVRWAFTTAGWGDTVWQQFTLDGRPAGGPVFIVDVAQHPSVPKNERRWREPRSIWNQTWFSTQRCANGLLRYARQVNNPDLQHRARLCTNLALSAPQADGLFPSIYAATTNGVSYALESETPGWDQACWTNSNRRPPDASADACHIADAAFTARHLLEWASLADDAAARAYAERFARRLCRLQLPSGAFPGWVEPDGTLCPTLREGPETAVGATLLWEMIERQHDRPEYRPSAERATAYLERGPVREGRWEDFETYFSCCRWGFPDQVGRTVARNGVYKSNTLSIFWCAEAFLAAYRVTGQAKYLALGRRCLDELTLYQQVWDPPFIGIPCHGGFGVMNADAEWNDARQSLFAPLLLEYGLVAGEPEYFERGVAALRASFAMLYCPQNDQVRRLYEKKHPLLGPESYGFMMENIAHLGPKKELSEQIGPFTIYTWGNGAALATAAKVRDLYGDVFIDDHAGRAFGIDGCTARVRHDRVRICDPFDRAELLAVYRSGPRRVVPLQSGAAELPLHP